MAEEIVFKTTVDTGNSVTAINNVDKALKEVNATVKSTSTDSTKAFDDLNKKVESGELSIKQLARAVKEYATIAIMAGEDSPIGQEAIRRAGQLKDRLADLGTQINNNARDGRGMQTAMQVGQGVAAGYAVAQGAMALFGSENKDLQKTLVKLQAAQALLAGIEQIRATLEKESLVRSAAINAWNKIKIAYTYTEATANGAVTTSLNIQRIAWMALPIVVIIAGIVALAAAMGAFSSDTETAAEGNDRLNESLERMGEAIDSTNAKLIKSGENRLKIIQSQGADAEDVHNQVLKNLDNENAARKYSMKGELESIKHKQIALKNARDEEDWELAKTIQNEIRTSQKKYKDLALAAEDYKTNQIVENNNYNAELEKTETDATDKQTQASKKRHSDAEKRQKEANAKRLELQQTIEDLLIANIEDNDLRRVAQLEMQQKREREQLVLKFGEDSKLLKELAIKQGTELDALNDEITQAKTEKQAEDDKLLLDIQNKDNKSRLEAKLINIRNDFALEQEVKKELADIELQQALLNTELTDGEIEKLHAEHKAKIDEIDKASAENVEKNKEARIKAAFEIADATMSSLNALNDLQNQLDANKLKNQNLTEAQVLEIKKKAFNRDKALKIATVSINTAEGISKSVAASPLTFGAPFSVFSAVTGIAQIAAIASTKFDGGGSSITSPTVPSGDGGGGNEGGGGFGSGSTSQVSSVGLTDNATGIKVTVVDSEIKAVMDASANASVLSTFGG
jgi:hypothetical protein